MHKSYVKKVSTINKCFAIVILFLLRLNANKISNNIKNIENLLKSITV